MMILPDLMRKGLRDKTGQDVLWNIASYAVMGLSGILMNFVIARAYDTTVLGVFNQVFAVYIVFSQIAVGGVHLSVLKHVAEFAADGLLYRPIIVAGTFLAMAFAAVTCIVYWILREPISGWLESPEVMTGVALSVPALFFFSINKVFLAVFNALSRMRTYAVFQALRYVLLLMALVFAAVVHWPGGKLAIVFSVVEILLFVGSLTVIYPELRGVAAGTAKNWFARHLDFGIRAFPGNVLLDLMSRVDVLILGFFASDRIVGIYSLAAIPAEGVYQLPVVFRTLANPVLVKLIAERKLDELKLKAREMGRSVFLLMSVVCVAAAIVYPLGIFLVSNRQDFMASWPLFSILMGGVLLSAAYIPLGNILLQAGRPGLHTLMIILLVACNVGANVVLIPLMGGLGAAVGTALSWVALVPMVRFCMHRVVGVKL